MQVFLFLLLERQLRFSYQKTKQINNWGELSFFGLVLKRLFLMIQHIFNSRGKKSVVLCREYDLFISKTFLF